jgi:hypothetical protein
LKEKQKFEEIIEDNKRKQLLQRIETKKEKDYDKVIIKQMMEQEEALQRQREFEFQKRLEKIQQKMAKMEDTVIKNNNAKRLEEEKKLLQMQMKKEREELEEENRRKNRIFDQNTMVKTYLFQQMENKQNKKL